MELSQSKIPPLKDLTIENITENTNLINSQCEDQRMKYVLERLVTHLHDFARETRLSTDEWMAGLMFLTQVGQISNDVRQVCVYLATYSLMDEAFCEGSRIYHAYIRNLSSYPTFLVSRFLSTQSIILNQLARLKGLFLVHSIRMKPKRSSMGS